MSSDALAWLVVLVLIVAVILGVMQHYTIAWVIVAAGIALIFFARLSRNK